VGVFIALLRRAQMLVLCSSVVTKWQSESHKKRETVRGFLIGINKLATKKENWTASEEEGQVEKYSSQSN
jgi:hypothetical protein